MALRRIKNLIVANNPAETALLHGSHYLGAWNELNERGLGDTPRAQKLLALGQQWHDEETRLRGWE
jgi:hypothetical protein